MEAGLGDIGQPSSFACPLLQLEGSHPFRFRCHTGHAYSIENLIAAVSDGIDESLWNAIRALEEGALLLQRLGTHLEQHGKTAAIGPTLRQARDLRHKSNVIRSVAMETDRTPASEA
ncbi:MAG TPA: hypothetical protein VD833_22385 [Vicinamibacterales bacterium]|nr:hypothetical protein [Vicinamibacterales bacterium]